jgi:hypothetical protein
MCVCVLHTSLSTSDSFEAIAPHAARHVLRRELFGALLACMERASPGAVAGGRQSRSDGDAAAAPAGAAAAPAAPANSASTALVAAGSRIGAEGPGGAEAKMGALRRIALFLERAKHRTPWLLTGTHSRPPRLRRSPGSAGGAAAALSPVLMVAGNGGGGGLSRELERLHRLHRYVDWLHARESRREHYSSYLQVS